MRQDLPAGTVTFLFTDVEGSTKVLHELGPERYAEVLSEHRRLIREACGSHGGVEVDTQGDAFFYAFPTAPGALAAAAAFTAAFVSGPVQVRVGLHTGTPLLAEDGYIGNDIHRAARIAAAGHGGQVLVSGSTAQLAQLELLDLGEHRFKDLSAPERIFQLGKGDFPPLKTLHRTNLPIPQTPFLGRERELLEVLDLLSRDDVRLLSLTGAGGTGKTRLALQAAAEAFDGYPDGVWWVPLAPLRDPGLILSVVARTLEVTEEIGRELSETLASALTGKKALLLLDNAEHLLPDAADVLESIRLIAGPVLLVTTRERLHLEGEQLYPVPTLDETDGMELFLARVRTLDPGFESDEAVRELCSRLDNLPLALELAAARTVVFSAEQLLERLTQRLDLLRGGRKVDPRQQTLRATIEWSFDLLTLEEQRVFRRLSVFANGCTYEAAEQVCEADPDSLQALLEKSLVRRRDAEFGPRYWMLETIREYAADRLEEDGEANALQLRHARWCCELADRLVGVPGRWYIGEGFGGFQNEYDNVRAALDWAWRSGEDELGLRLGGAVCRFWMRRGFYDDSVSWLRAATPKITGASAPVQLQALKAAGVIAFFVLADTEEADRFWMRALAVAEELGEDDEIVWIEDRRAAVRWERGDLELALAHFERSLSHYRARENRLGQAESLHLLGEMLRDLGRFVEAEAALLEADSIFRDLGMELGVANNTHSLADLALDRGDLEQAVELYRQSLEVDQRQGPQRGIAYCLAGIASVLAERGRDLEAGTIWGAVCAAEEQLGFRMLSAERRRYEIRLTKLEGTGAWTEGRTLTLEEALAAALEEPQDA